MLKSFRIAETTPYVGLLHKKQRSALCLRVKIRLSAHNSQTVYVHPIIFSRLQDWSYKQLEGMEHIRRKHEEGQPYFYFLGQIPGGIRKGRKKGLEPVLDDEQRRMLSVWSQQFWSLHGFQSRIVSPSLPGGEKWRQIHGCLRAKVLEDDCSFCRVLRGAAW